MTSKEGLENLVDESMNKTIQEFSNLLRERLNRKVNTTEDSVRYTFFVALNKTNINPHEIILEYHHPKDKRLEIDTYIPSISERPGLVIEFKYDRGLPSGHNSPRPLQAGKLLKDIKRLSRFDIDSKAALWFIYLTDTEMVGYLRNERNKLIDFFELPTGEVLRVDEEYISSKSSTFQKAINGHFSADIRCIWKEEMPNQHELRVYEIKPR